MTLKCHLCKTTIKSKHAWDKEGDVCPACLQGQMTREASD